VLVAHGYGAAAGPGAARLLTDGQTPPQEGWQSCGEESLLLARLAPGVPILIAPRRARAWPALQESGVAADVAILDGGFQSHDIHQDLRIVMLDASRSPEVGRLLPLGDLREPWSALERAQLIVLHRAELCGDQQAWTQWLEAHAPGCPLLWTRNRWGTPYLLRSEGTEERARSWPELAQLQLGIWTGIGHPASFVAGVRAQGVEPAAELLARDHAAFTQRDAERLQQQTQRRGLDGWLVTEKDAVKMEAWAAEMPEVYVVPARIELAHGGPQLDQLCRSALRAGRM
jgi:tetraacyldisaccharide 4'-kinase